LLHSTTPSGGILFISFCTELSVMLIEKIDEVIVGVRVGVLEAV
jgi:hypothetical protein